MNRERRSKSALTRLSPCFCAPLELPLSPLTLKYLCGEVGPNRVSSLPGSQEHRVVSGDLDVHRGYDFVPLICER